jgi:uncharacterized protein (TIGR02145 family)
MKTNLFRKTHLMRLALLLLPLLGRGLGGGCVLLAQSNGVKVSNLLVSAGTPSTVTFDVQWTNDHAPEFVWSDTVWVFVDYNNNGKMERLPVTGATLTATSASGVGKVVEDAGNNQGVWVVGNARNAGTFSATVQLFTTVKDVAGACAYASNYPPVGKYSNDAPLLSFTGTPPYELLLAKVGNPTETEQVESGNTFILPCNYTLTSFTDATGAPGIMDESCTAPGRTVDFTAFEPCSNATAGDYWYLTDTREPSNIQTYKVKQMADGRIWMVQNLKFGDKCNKEAYVGNTSSDQKGNLTTISGDYFGDCMNRWDASRTPDARGYLYNWAAAVNKSGAYYGGSYKGCSGKSAGTTSTNPGACRGICPVGWHIPTGGTSGEFYDLHNASGRNCSTSSDKCWNASSDWEGVLGGDVLVSGALNGPGEHANYWTSTDYGNSVYAYCLLFYSTSVLPGTSFSSKYSGFPVRCVRNY